jgi:hypothetical protein
VFCRAIFLPRDCLRNCNTLSNQSIEVLVGIASGENRLHLHSKQATAAELLPVTYKRPDGRIRMAF